MSFVLGWQSNFELESSRCVAFATYPSERYEAAAGAPVHLRIEWRPPQPSQSVSRIKIHLSSKSILAFNPSQTYKTYPGVMSQESWFMIHHNSNFFGPWRISYILICPTMWATIANKTRHLYLLACYQSLPRFARSALNMDTWVTHFKRKSKLCQNWN